MRMLLSQPTEGSEEQCRLMAESRKSELRAAAWHNRSNDSRAAGQTRQRAGSRA
jgi:hypothetical protein